MASVAGSGPGPVIVFDLGGVLIDWNPRYLYRQLFEDEAAMEFFLTEICSPAWNARQDAGRSFAEAVRELSERHPEQRALIEAYHHRWPEMIEGALDDTVAILAQLVHAGFEVHALTNWSAETFPIARDRFAFLDWFETILVSGEVGMMKPDRAIFDLLLERIDRPAAGTIFIDDSAANIEAAGALGFDAIRFTGADELRSELSRRRLFGID